MKKSSSETTLTLPSEKQILTAREQLVTWYQENKRALPWRKNRNPYTIWISEVMLQQTTVAAVMPYFEKILRVLLVSSAMIKDEDFRVSSNLVLTSERLPMGVAHT